MLYTICIASAILLVFIIILIIKSQIMNIDGYNIRIEESSKSIEMLQKEEINLLTKISKKVKEQTEESVFKDLPKMKNKSLDMFELDKKLFDLNKELNDTFEYNKINFEKEDMDLLNKYRDNKIELGALKQYYNDSIESYNKYIKSIKRLFIKILKKLKQKDTFDIEKEVEFEILKKNNSSED